MSSKIKGKLVAVVFIIVMLLPVCYALIRHFCSKDTEVQKVVPDAGSETK